MYTPAVVKALIVDLQKATSVKEFDTDCILGDIMQEYLVKLKAVQLPQNEHMDKFIGEPRLKLVKALCLMPRDSEFYHLSIPSVKVFRVLNTKEKLYCEICSRQIVSYEADDKWCIGPGKNCLRLVRGWACPSCSEDERAFDDLEG